MEDRRGPSSQSSRLFPRELPLLLGPPGGNMASALEQFVNSVRQLSAQGEALGRRAGPGRTLRAAGTGLQPQPPARTAGTSLLVPSLVSGAGIGVAALRPGGFGRGGGRAAPSRSRSQWLSSPGLCARRPGHLPSLGPAGPSSPRPGPLPPGRFA